MINIKDILTLISTGEGRLICEDSICRELTKNSANTGCFRVYEIMLFLISQPIKHLNSLNRSYIFTESIAF